MNTIPISSHIRVNKGVLASVEKRVLLWLAERLPLSVTSDHLTLLGFASMLLAGLAYFMARWDERCLYFVVIALALNWFGDSLDGTLARVRNQQRPHYGFYVDHVIDIIGTSLLLGGLALSGYMEPLIALGLLAVYLMVAAETFLATYVQGVFRLSSFCMGPTELRIILAIGTLYLLHKPIVQLGDLGSFRLFDVGGVIGIAGLIVTFVVSSVQKTVLLYQAEPPPK